MVIHHGGKLTVFRGDHSSGRGLLQFDFNFMPFYREILEDSSPTHSVHAGAVCARKSWRKTLTEVQKHRYFSAVTARSRINQSQN